MSTVGASAYFGMGQTGGAAIAVAGISLLASGTGLIAWELDGAILWTGLIGEML
ncbi:MAG: hypothetical protein R6X29_07575 [Acidimicrobiia bacterium]|jgi:hypothetical protein